MSVVPSANALDWKVYENYSNFTLAVINKNTANFIL